MNEKKKKNPTVYEWKKKGSDQGLFSYSTRGGVYQNINYINFIIYYHDKEEAVNFESMQRVYIHVYMIKTLKRVRGGLKSHRSTSSIN